MIRLSQKQLNMAFLAYILLVLILSVLPAGNNNPNINVQKVYVAHVRADFLIHFILFIPFAFFIRFAKGVRFQKSWKAFLFWLVFGICFAVVSELVQYLIPYRSFSKNDLAFNVTGVLLGYFVLMIWQAIVIFGKLIKRQNPS